MNILNGESTRRGLASGLVATLALAFLLWVMQVTGLMPQIDLVGILGRALGLHSVGAAWTAHCIIGVLCWGPLFALADRKMYFAHWLNGGMFASVIWLGVMLTVMPLAGAGVFGLKLGLATPTLTLFLHWFYGIVLGSSYGALAPGSPSETLKHQPAI